MAFSFSPHFSQRWANTSKLIRQAIATELSDIITLLQPETNLDEFQFTHPDLTAYINEIEAKLDADEQATRPVVSPVVSVVSPVIANLVANPASANANKTANDANSCKQTTSSSQPSSSEKKSSSPQPINNTSTSVANDSPPSVELTDQLNALISGLEMRIDDYLADHMAQMSEELKAWLRNEVKRQLADSQPLAT